MAGNRHNLHEMRIALDGLRKDFDDYDNTIANCNNTIANLQATIGQQQEQMAAWRITIAKMAHHLRDVECQSAECNSSLNEIISLTSKCVKDNNNERCGKIRCVGHDDAGNKVYDSSSG